MIRGGPDMVAKLATHARRTCRAYSLDGQPLYGVSVFLALDDIGPASLTGLLGDRMSTYRLVHTPTVAFLQHAGFPLVPTFRRPHYTLRLGGDTQEELRLLLDALGPPEVNPYYGGGTDPRGR